MTTTSPIETTTKPQALAQEPSQAPRLSKVLCIEDDPHMSLALDLWLKQYEVEVCHAHYGMQGLSMAISEQPDVIITDICMPQGEGDQLIAELQEHEETQSIPVIVVTGRKDKSLERRMMQLGVKKFLHKPVTRAILHESMLEVFKLPKIEQRHQQKRPHIKPQR